MTIASQERRRARNDEQKQERRQHLIEVTRRLYEANGHGYEALTIAEVAAAAELAKGTVFLYFRTKEELFLALHEQLLQEWFDALDAHLEKLKPPVSVAKMADLICQSLEGRSALTSLLAILHVTLEENADYPTVLAFKRLLYRRFNLSGPLFERCLPFLRPGQGAEVFLQIDALIIGLHHLSYPGPLVRQALEEPELAMFRVDFDRAFGQSVRALLAGLERFNSHLP